MRTIDHTQSIITFSTHSIFQSLNVYPSEVTESRMGLISEEGLKIRADILSLNK